MLDFVSFFFFLSFLSFFSVVDFSALCRYRFGYVVIVFFSFFPGHFTAAFFYLFLERFFYL